MKIYISVLMSVGLLFFLFSENPAFGSPANPSPKLLPVPIVRQATSYSCGAASLLAVLYFWKFSNQAEVELYEPLKTTKELGTHPKSIAEYSKSLGLKTELRTEVTLAEIESAIDKNEPVIVDYQAWGEAPNGDYSAVWDSGHYGVVIGYDSTHLYFMDPVLGSSYGQLDKKNFMKRWHDFELENGVQQKYNQLAIFISGTERLSQFPGPLAPIN